MYFRINATNYTAIDNLSFSPEADLINDSLPINEFEARIFTNDVIAFGQWADLYDDQDHLYVIRDGYGPQTAHDRISGNNACGNDNRNFIVDTQHGRKNDCCCDELAGRQSDQRDKCNDTGDQAGSLSVTSAEILRNGLDLCLTEHRCKETHYDKCYADCYDIPRGSQAVAIHTILHYTK